VSPCQQPFQQSLQLATQSMSGRVTCLRSLTDVVGVLAGRYVLSGMCPVKDCENGDISPLPVGPMHPGPVQSLVEFVPNREKLFRSSIMLFRSELMLFRGELMLFRDELMLFRSELMLFRSELMLFRSELMLFRSELMLFRSELMLFRDELMLFRSEMMLFRSEMMLFRSRLMLFRSRLMLFRRDLPFFRVSLKRGIPGSNQKSERMDHRMADITQTCDHDPS